MVSNTLEGPLDWAGGTIAGGDAVDVVARLKEESEVPLRSHGSLSMNRALMAAGLVDRVQVTIFPVITGQTGDNPIFQGAADFDLELIEQSDARRQHPGADLPAQPARLSPPVSFARHPYGFDLVRATSELKQPRPCFASRATHPSVAHRWRRSGATCAFGAANTRPLASRHPYRRSQTIRLGNRWAQR